MSERIEQLIDIWSMRPAPNSPSGKAWEDGARQGYEWGLRYSAAPPPPAPSDGLVERFNVGWGDCQRELSHSMKTVTALQDELSKAASRIAELEGIISEWLTRENSALRGATKTLGKVCDERNAALARITELEAEVRKLEDEKFELITRVNDEDDTLDMMQAQRDAALEQVRVLRGALEPFAERVHKDGTIISGRIADEHLQRAAALAHKETKGSPK